MSSGPDGPLSMPTESSSRASWLLPPPLARLREHLREIRRVLGEAQQGAIAMPATVGAQLEQLEEVTRVERAALEQIEAHLQVLVEALVPSAPAAGAPAETYGADYYERHRAGSARSAEAILPIVFGLARPASAVDVGCGTGTWLAIASGLGARDVLGIDGDWVPTDALEIPVERFIRHDLEQPLPPCPRHDLAICVEVAEHLGPARAESLVADLCQLADVVLFSAAVPGQLGEGHRNEQWPSYWRARFARRGYELVDCVRPRLWGDDQIEHWYVQNTFLYVKAERLASDSRLGEEAARTRGMPVCVIHPRLFGTLSPPQTPPDPEPMAER